MNEVKPRQIGARNHQQDCTCGMCVRIRENEKIASEKEKRGKKPRRRLTVGNRRFIQEFINLNSPAFKCASKAAVLAGYSADSADDAGASLLRNPQVQRSILQAFVRQGIDDDFLAAKVRAGLDATATWRHVNRETGKVIERTDPDPYARHKYVETAMRARGDFPKEDNGPTAALILKLPTACTAEEAEAQMNAYFAEQTRREAPYVAPRA